MVALPLTRSQAVSAMMIAQVVHVRLGLEWTVLEAMDGELRPTGNGGEVEEWRVPGTSAQAAAWQPVQPLGVRRGAWNGLGAPGSCGAAGGMRPDDSDAPVP